MCERVDTSTSRSKRVACAATMKTKNGRENLKRGYKVQIEDPNPVEKIAKEKRAYST